MIGAVLLALAALGGPVESASAPSSTADVPPKSALQTAQDAYARIEQLYAESCSDRAYGSYDDLCNQLAHQVHESRVELDRLERDDEAKARSSRPH